MSATNLKSDSFAFGTAVKDYFEGEVKPFFTGISSEGDMWDVCWGSFFGNLLIACYSTLIGISCLNYIDPMKILPIL